MLKNILLTIVCAGREPIVGAMWFIYVLLFSLIGFCMVSFICRHLTHTESVYTGTRLVVFTFLQLVSCMLTKQFGLTIPRCSNVFSVMLLIFIGQQIFQKYKIQFDNGYLAIISAIFVYQGSLLMGNGMVNLNVNDYSDMMQLTIGSLASLYFLGYISKKIENYMIGIWLNYLGKESFYIMSLANSLPNTFLFFLALLNCFLLESAYRKAIFLPLSRSGFPFRSRGNAKAFFL